MLYEVDKTKNVLTLTWKSIQWPQYLRHGGDVLYVPNQAKLSIYFVTF